VNHLLSEWSNFYVIIGSAAAALTDLMFVVVTLIAGRTPPDGMERGTATFSTPTVVHLSAAFISRRHPKRTMEFDRPADNTHRRDGDRRQSLCQPNHAAGSRNGPLRLLYIGS